MPEQTPKRIPEWLTLTGIVAAVTLGTYLLLNVVMVQKPVPVANTGPALESDWQLVMLDGAPAALSDYTGQVTLLTLWATWCGPCMDEMPHIQGVQEQLADEGLRVLAVAVSDDPANVRRVAREKRWTFDIAVPRDDRPPPAALASRGIPTTFVLSPTGEVLARQVGYYAWDSEVSIESLRDVLARYAPTAG